MKKLKQHASLDEVEQELFTRKDIKSIREAAAQRSATRRILANQLSHAIAAYMTQEKIGFNELQQRLGVSTATTAKLIKGDGNVTLETIALVSQLIGMIPELRFEKRA